MEKWSSGGQSVGGGIMLAGWRRAEEGGRVERRTQ